MISINLERLTLFLIKGYILQARKYSLQQKLKAGTSKEGKMKQGFMLNELAKYMYAKGCRNSY